MSKIFKERSGSIGSPTGDLNLIEVYKNFLRNMTFDKSASIGDGYSSLDTFKDHNLPIIHEAIGLSNKLEGLEGDTLSVVRSKLATTLSEIFGFTQLSKESSMNNLIAIINEIKLDLSSIGSKQNISSILKNLPKGNTELKLIITLTDGE